ncbi:MAG: efflux RND transporter periplasmic adaptor subunit, partial [Planctomycetota bacterium]
AIEGRICTRKDLTGFLLAGGSINDAAQLAEARAGVLAANAEAERAALRLRQKTITAPFAGRVITRAAERGQWIDPGDAIVEVVSLTEVEAVVAVPEASVAFLEEGAEVQTTIPGLGEAQSVRATITRIIPSADRMSRVFPVRLAIEAGTDALKPGMSVTALVPTGITAVAITVHKDAVLQTPAGERVYMAVPLPDAPPAGAGPSHQAIPVPVRVQFAAGDRVSVRAERLFPGAALVVEGNERLFPTQPLIMNNPGDLPPPRTPAGSPAPSPSSIGTAGATRRESPSASTPGSDQP